jgi:hypothetical protein
VMVWWMRGRQRRGVFIVSGGLQGGKPELGAVEGRWPLLHSVTHRIVPSRALIGQTSDASSLNPRETHNRVLAPRFPTQKPLAASTGPRHDTGM